MKDIYTRNRFKACILVGAIGDAMGSAHENNHSNKTQNEGDIFHFFPKPPKKKILQWRITDDTQLTLATCEAIAANNEVIPAEIAKKFNYYHQNRKLSGVGSSTLKALQALAMGADWSQAGRRGEFAAGNGAAMRIAPLAFVMSNLDRRLIEDVCRITHHNTEAYAGALAVLLAIRSIIEGKWTGANNLLEILIPQIPDTNVRDRLIAIQQLPSNTGIEVVGKQFGSSAYVVESIPLAIFAASKALEIGLGKMFQTLIEIGGDTDTNCSIAGQIAGAAMGVEKIPLSLIQQLKELDDYEWIERVIGDFLEKCL